MQHTTHLTSKQKYDAVHVGAHKTGKPLRALTDAIPFHAAFFLKLSRFGEPDI